VIVALGLTLPTHAEPPPRAGLAAKPVPRIMPRPAPRANPAIAPKDTPPSNAAAPDAPDATAAGAAEPAGVISVRGDRLTVQVSDLPLDEVLRRIAQPSEAEVHGSVVTPRNVTADFTDVPLQDGLSRLLGEQNFLLTYRVDGRLRRLTLLGGAVEVPAETRVVRAGPEPPQAESSPGDLLQRRIPVRGKLQDFLGQDGATLQQLMDIALRQDDAALRTEAVTVGLNAIDTQPDLRAAVVRSLGGAGDQVLEGLLGSVTQDRAMEILNQLMRSRIPELRTSGVELVRRMRESSQEAPEP
jgi:hypothetical protein